MKRKLFLELILSTVLIFANNNSAYAGQFLYHSHCFDKYIQSDNRWGIGTDESDRVVILYDSETITKENKFVPFADRKISLWILQCEAPGHYTQRYRVTFNLDKRTYIRTSAPKPKMLPITPDSIMEKVFNIAKRLY